jgi:hypothetical protein
MKARVFSKAENADVNIDSVMTLCLPISIDGGSDKLWKKFANCIIDS